MPSTLPKLTALPASESPKLIKAVVVDAHQVEAEMHKIRNERQQAKARQARALKTMKHQMQLAQRQRHKAEQALAKARKALKQRKKTALKQKKPIAKTVHKKFKASRAVLTQKQVQDDLAKDVAAEEDRLNAMKYQSLMVRAIAAHWLVPPSADTKLSCRLLIHLAPGGKVLSVQLVKSSGDTALDRSARMAVIKASPLPVPSDPQLFKQFKDIRLTVRPDEVIT